MKITASWDMMPCSLVDHYQILELHDAPTFWLDDRSIFRVENEGNNFFKMSLHGLTSQRTTVFIIIAVINSYVSKIVLPALLFLDLFEMNSVKMACLRWVTMNFILDRNIYFIWWQSEIFSMCDFWMKKSGLILLKFTVPIHSNRQINKIQMKGSYIGM